MNQEGGMSSDPQVETLREARQVAQYLRTYAALKAWPRLLESAEVVDALAAKLAEARRERDTAKALLTHEQSDAYYLALAAQEGDTHG